MVTNTHKIFLFGIRSSFCQLEYELTFDLKEVSL